MVFLRFDVEHFGLERSGRSVGFLFTSSRTYKSQWCLSTLEDGITVVDVIIDTGVGLGGGASGPAPDNSNGGVGGSGVVVIRYKYQN